MLRSSIALAAAAGLMLSGCGTFTCDNWVSKDEILESWIGSNLADYERQTNRRPFETLTRPQNRTEYSYVAYEEWIDGNHYECVDRLTVDNATGEIVDWAYDGTQCVGYCAG